MPFRIIQNERDLAGLHMLLANQAMPFTVQISKGKNRTLEQNKLQRLWCNEISEQLGDRTPEEVRGECKLTLGVPILRAENEDFAEKYDKLIRPRSYEDKLELMMMPMDFPITRLMTTGQTTKYLDAIVQHYSKQGVVLTKPERG